MLHLKLEKWLSMHVSMLSKHGITPSCHVLISHAGFGQQLSSWHLGCAGTFLSCVNSSVQAVLADNTVNHMPDPAALEGMTLYEVMLGEFRQPWQFADVDRCRIP